MKIAMISGSWPPVRCGVGDYSSVLCQHLSAEGIDVHPFEWNNWSLKATRAYTNAVKAINPDLIHIQYPSVGYGRSLLPAATPYLFPKIPVVVTLHEFEIFKRYRWPWFYPYAKRANVRIFSRTAERDAFELRFPVRKGANQIVPIGSNIPVSTDVERQLGSVVFFGLFWPGKGIEEFIQFAELVSNNTCAIKLTLLGAPVEGQEAFVTDLRNTCQRYGIELHEGLPAVQVAKILAAHEFAYLPFPEGADERRGSLAATLVNGCCVLTPHKAQTPDWLRTATIAAPSPTDVFNLLQSRPLAEAAKAEVDEYAKAAAARYDWSRIAALHKEIYTKAIGDTRPPHASLEVANPV